MLKVLAKMWIDLNSIKLFLYQIFLNNDALFWRMYMLYTVKLKLVRMPLMSICATKGWKSLINVYKDRDSLLLQLRALFSIASPFSLHFPTIDTIVRLWERCSDPWASLPAVLGATCPQWTLQLATVSFGPAYTSWQSSKFQINQQSL